jgi:hypothetical protein
MTGGVLQGWRWPPTLRNAARALHCAGIISDTDLFNCVFGRRGEARMLV